MPVDVATTLVAYFGQLLARARAFRADREVVDMLSALDTRTQDVVATVSHELRTPLTVISGLSRTLEQRWAELDDGMRAQLCSRIEGNTDRLHDMIASLLRTSAFDQDEIRVSLAATSLAPLVDEVADRMRSVWPDHPITTDIPADLMVVADQMLLLHVLENLVSNAGKHTPVGTAIRVVARCDGESVMVAVSDDGPGIAPTELAHVQERFFRGGDPDQRGTSGLGLGLALVQRLLDVHGTFLSLTSDAGLTASFELPRAGVPG